MLGLLDIAPPEIVTETFEIRGGKLEVRALRNRELAKLRRRFPALERRAQDEIETLDMAVEVAPAVIAAALGCIGDEVVEATLADRLTEDERWEIFVAIMRLGNPPAPLAESPVEAGQVSNGQATTSTPPQLNI